MGKFYDVLEKMAKKERPQDTPVTLPSPQKHQKRENDAAESIKPPDATAQSDDSKTDSPSLFILHGAVSADAEKQRKDKPASIVQLETTVKSDLSDADCPNLFVSHAPASTEVEKQDEDDTASKVSLASPPESADSDVDYPPNLFVSHAPVSTEMEKQVEEDATSTVSLTSPPESADSDVDYPPNLFVSHAPVPTEMEKQVEEDATSSASLTSPPESADSDADYPNLFVSHAPVSTKVEKQMEDDTTSSASLTSPSESADSGVDYPNLFISNASLSDVEKKKSGKAKARIKVNPTSKSELIRLTKLWPFVYHDPISTEPEKQGTSKTKIKMQFGPMPTSALAHPVDPNLVVYHDPASVEAEIFKVLRNNILFPKDGTPPPSIMITSATPGDGKSFIAANLAVSIARGIEEHVLLMDCDMRRSSIHRTFGFSDNLQGLSEYLSKGIALPPLLKKTIVDKLSILPGGKPPDNPSELLSSQRMKDLLDETKSRYHDRFIIVDSPPPQLTAETTALAKYIDSILIVVRSGKTPKVLVENLIEKLGREKIIGVVLNGYHIPASERYGYGRYGMREYEQ